MLTVIASEAPPAVQWAVTAAIVVVIGSLVALAIRSNARRARPEVANVVPLELRGHAPSSAPLIWLALVVGLAGAFIGGWLAGAAGAMVGLFAGFIPFFAMSMRRERAHRARVVEEASRRAAGMDRQQLADMVAGLEHTHGRKPMRPLRELLLERTDRSA